VDVDGFVFSGYASSLAALSETEKELGVVLVDIGAGTTDISVYVEGSVAHSSVLPIGARHITNDLAIGLRISLESAEKLKIFLSRQQPKEPAFLPDEDGRKVRSTDEVDLSSLHLPEDIKLVSRKTLVEGIIRPRLNEIFSMVGQELKKSGWGGQTPAGLVITGGGAKTVGMVDAAKRTMAMPVRIGMPHDLKGIKDEIEDPASSTVIGLIMYGTTIESHKSMPFGFSLPGIKMPSGKFGKKLLDFIKSFMP
jgi:cell division protein FtsA